MGRDLNINDLLDRVNLLRDLEEVIIKVLQDFEIGDLVKVEPLFVGHEEFNCAISTSKGKYVIKFINKQKNRHSVSENIKVINSFHNSGIPVPKLIKDKKGRSLYKLPKSYGNGYLFITEYFDGQTFNQSLPTQKDMLNIALYLAKINNLKIQAEPEYDIWILEHLLKEYPQKRKYLSSEDMYLTDKVFKEFKTIDFSKLDKGTVHYDLHRDNAQKDKNDKYMIFDFATVGKGYPVLDLASYIGLFCISPNLSKLENEENYTKVLSEYQKIHKLNSYELSVLPLLVKGIWVSNIMASSFLIATFEDDTNETYKWYLIGKENLINLPNLAISKKYLPKLSIHSVKI